MSPITTHILDTASGKPATGVPITLEIHLNDGFKEIGKGITDSDGRVKNLLHSSHDLTAGVYRISFDTKSYYESISKKTFYPTAQVTFEVEEEKTSEHYHVPLLLSGFGYSTYRGS
jgi:5-hydroxyisourate hydrolase